MITEMLKKFVEDTTKKLVDNPNEVGINVSISTKSVIVQIKVSKKDFGKIIGKKGRTIEALKLLTSAIKNTQFPDDMRRVNLEILEEESSGFKSGNK